MLDNVAGYEYFPETIDSTITWLNNTGCTPSGQFFCVYSNLETGDWFAASEKGTRELDSEPAYVAPACVCY
jgi:hypothetical protein